MRRRKADFRRVVVTGGSSGIGYAVARELAVGGSRLMLVARNVERLAAARASLASVASEDSIYTLAGDVGEEATSARLGSAVRERLGGLDLIVNCAGDAHVGYFEETGHEVLDRLYRSHLRGSWLVTQALLPYLNAPGGAVVNVASMAAVVGVFGYSAYSSVKFGLAGFSEVLRAELAPRGISVSLVCPPDTDTPQLARENESKPPETRAIAGRSRVLQPAVVARVMLHEAARGRFLIIPGAFNRFIHMASRLAPALVRALMDADVAALRRRKQGVEHAD